MPLFEYSCQDCSKRFTFLTGVVQNEPSPSCPVCGSLSLTKLMSRFRRGRDDDARMDALADRLDDGGLDDPANLRRFAQEMSREIEAETGESLAEDFEQLAAEEYSAEELSAKELSAEELCAEELAAPEGASHTSGSTRDEKIY